MKLDLKNREWKEFKISDVFIISKVYGLPLEKCKSGSTPFITTSKSNNGLIGFAKEDSNNLSNKNSISIDPISGKAFYHEYDFIGRGFSGASVNLIHNNELNRKIALFICKAIEKTSQLKASYGYLFNGNRLKNSKIMLPINENHEPDYKFMEQFIRHKEKEKQKEYQHYIQNRLKELKNIPKTVALNKKEWGEFFIQELAEILSGKDIYARERIEGNTPYVSATANLNGIGYFVNNENKTLESNCLSVNRNGSVGYSFYHPYKALFGNDCRKLKLKNSNKHIGIFISQQITRQKGKYGYGYKMGTARLKRQKIMLPINKKHEPDYEFMENYIKNLEYNKLNKYLKQKTN